MGGPQFFRGDAWQLVLSDPGKSLRVAIYLRARLLALDDPADTRIGIGLGSVEELNPDEVSLSVGEAFTLSGLTLDDMRRRRDIWVSYPEWLESKAFWLPAVLGLCSTIVGRWKVRQAQLVGRMLLDEELTHDQVAKRSNVTRQSVSKSLVAAGWSSVSDAVALVESVDWSHDGDGLRG